MNLFSSGRRRRQGVRSIAPLLGAVLAFANVPPSISFAQVAERRVPTTDPAVLEQQLTYYYRAPSDVLDMVKRWERLRPTRSQNVGMIGFLAGVFAKNPTLIDSIIKAEFEVRTQSMVVFSLLLADRRPEAIRGAIGWNWSSDQVAGIPKHTPLIQSKPTNPAAFDTLWAASFATGDARYVQLIYSFYDSVASDQAVNVNNIVTLAVGLARRDRQAVDGIRKKYPQEIFERLASAASALWSLESNGRQHAFVEGPCLSAPKSVLRLQPPKN